MSRALSPTGRSYSPANRCLPPSRGGLPQVMGAIALCWRSREPPGWLRPPAPGDQCAEREETQTLISMGGKCLRRSLLRLHRLEEGEDGPQRLVVQHSLPVRHALFSPAMRDGEVEHVGRLLAVAALEAAQVSGRIGADRVRRMAMCAILIEQAAARSAPARVVRADRGGRIVGAHIRRCDRQTKQSGE